MRKFKPLVARLIYLPLILFFTLACQANGSKDPMAVGQLTGDGFLNNPNNISILVDHTTLQMQQNQYQEIEFSASGQNITQLQWFSDQDEILPPGMELQILDATRALLKGYPQFAGTWCFKLNALDQASSSQARSEVCLNAKEDAAYPLKFKTQQRLAVANINRYYSQPVEWQTSNAIKANLQGQVVNLSIEPFQVQFQKSTNRFLIQGQSPVEGQKSFSLRLWTQNENDNANSEFYEVYKQYTVDIVDQSNNQYACPAGYYFSETLRYCIQAEGTAVCSAGTFYNPDSNTCVAYAPPPTYVTCSYNEVFDSYLGQCVLREYPRCPLNYRWNQFDYRCDRLAYTCPLGTTYSYAANTCVQIWQNSCGRDQYWDNYAGRCRTQIRYCTIGSYWNPVYDRCEVSSYYNRCGRDQNWNWYTNRCERNSTPRCQSYEDYDFNRGYCVRREIDRSCSSRERWSPGDRRCVPWITPDPVRPPYRPEPIRPRPEPVRPTPPGPIRPRPEPVRPSPEPIRPRPEPVRPSPEPVRPRPEPVRPSPEPVRPRPEPVRPSPEPVRPRPEPVRPSPEPVRPRPEPVRPSPEPVRPRPEPVRPAPEPERPRPEPVRPAPEPERPRPEPVRPAPEPERPRPEPVRPSPAPERPAPERPAPGPERPPRYRP